MILLPLGILLIIFHAANSNAIPSVPVRVSPLDTGLRAPVRPTPPPPIPVQPVALPFCETACFQHVRGVLDMLFASGILSESKEKVCAHYFKAEECMRPLTHCTHSFYPIITSGIRYMCVDQSKAFDSLLDCIGASSPTIKQECDVMCNPASLVAGLAVKDTFMQSLDQPSVNQAVDVKNLIEPHIGRIAFSEGCRITECLFQCYKNKFNMMCEGTAGTLIMEMLARPLSSEVTDVPLETQILSTFFNGMLPHTCKFLTDKQNFRINPELDAEIKRMYANRKTPTAEDFKQFGKPAAIPNPPNPHSRIASPLENSNMLNGGRRGQGGIPIDADTVCIEDDPQRLPVPPKDGPRLPPKALLVSDGPHGDGKNFVVLHDK